MDGEDRSCGRISPSSPRTPEGGKLGNVANKVGKSRWILIKSVSGCFEAAFSRRRKGEEEGNDWEKTSEPSFEKGRRKRVAFGFLWAPLSLRG